MSTAIVIEYFI
jgi:hypothetical protein